MNKNTSFDGTPAPSKHDSTPLLKKMLNIIKSAPRVSPLHSDRSVCVNLNSTPRRLTQTFIQDNIRPETCSETTTTSLKKNLGRANITDDDPIKHDGDSSKRGIVAKDNKMSSTLENTKKKIIIIGDQMGRDVRKILKNLCGENYHVIFS